MKKSIYVVEDNDDIRELIVYLLEVEAYEVQGFATATLFADQMKIANPDLIVLDVMLPDGNGVAICSKLKSKEDTQQIPVLLMSANTNVANIIQESSANDFMSKPFDIDNLIERVKLLLNS